MMSNSEAELEHLAQEWFNVKARERKANAKRLAIESQILKLAPAREEGSSSLTLPNGVRIKATGKLSYKADLDKLLEITANWPEEQKPIKVETTPDEAALKFYRANRPDLWRKLADAVTVKPLKTSITIEEPDDGV